MGAVQRVIGTLAWPPAELLCFLRDAVDTHKAALMEVALDCIQKLISFKLLQGPVHHINHRRAGLVPSAGAEGCRRSRREGARFRLNRGQVSVEPWPGFG
jgi:hypothetical protein